MTKASQHMQRVQWVGTCVFWLTWPALFFYLLIGKRTRVLLQVGDEFLVVKGWLGSGDWQLPGGGLHRHEPSTEGLLRELREETGISLVASQLTLVRADNLSKGGLRFRFDLYHVILPQKPVVKLQAYELLDYAWLPLKPPTDNTQLRLTADALQSLELIAPQPSQA